MTICKETRLTLLWKRSIYVSHALCVVNEFLLLIVKYRVLGLSRGSEKLALQCVYHKLFLLLGSLFIFNWKEIFVITNVTHLGLHNIGKMKRKLDILKSGSWIEFDRLSTLKLIALYILCGTVHVLLLIWYTWFIFSPPQTIYVYPIMKYSYEYLNICWSTCG